MRADLLVPYVSLLQQYVQEADELQRELLLEQSSELAKTALTEGPAQDQMLELHRQAQALLAEMWRPAAPESPAAQAREALVRGDAQPMLVALLLPHELEQRAHHEKRWRREHETLVAMFEQTDELILVLDPQGQCEDVNPAFCRATGWTRRQAAEGAADWDDMPSLDRSRQVRRPQPCSDGRMLNIEWSISPILGSKGELISHVCIGRDIGRQQQIEQGLRENDKLRAVATLAGGIAHDFNNLLGSINGLAELCELEAEPGSRQARNLARIRQAGDKAAALVRQMLDFSRQRPPALQPVALACWLAELEPLLRAALSHRHTLTLDVNDDAPVLIDQVQMEQVLLNIVRNAGQAMAGDAGSVRLHVAQTAPPASLDQPAPLVPEPGRTQPWVRLDITDTGPGIPPDVLGKIFEPFFTTKPVGEGTGLGLSAVHGIVSSHGGQIEVHSTVGAGATFSILLPCLRDRA